MTFHVLYRLFYIIEMFDLITVYANYIGPSVMTDANSEGFPTCDERITENDRCVIKIIGIHCNHAQHVFCNYFTFKYMLCKYLFIVVLVQFEM